MASAAKLAELAKRGLSLTEPGQVSFPNLFRVQEYEGKWTFNVHLVWSTEEEVVALKEFVRDFVKREAQGGKVNLLVDDPDNPGKKKLHPSFRWPWRPGAEKLDDDGKQRDGFKSTDTFIVFKKHVKNVTPETAGTVKPSFDVVDIAGRPLQPQDVYAGCRGVVCFRPFVYRKGPNVGVSLSLEAFQKVADGTPIGGAGPVAASSVFDYAEAGDELDVDDI